MTHTTFRHHRLTSLAALLLIGSIPLGLTACSSGPDTSTAKDATSGVGVKWGSCMRDAGFNVQDPTDAQVESGVMQVPPGNEQEEFKRAASACTREAGVQGASSADKQKWEREYAKVASCIREDYADFPEQQPGALDFSSYPRSEESGFQKVMQACLEQFSPSTTSQNVS